MLLKTDVSIKYKGTIKDCYQHCLVLLNSLFLSLSIVPICDFDLMDTFLGSEWLNYMDVSAFHC